MCLDMPLFYLVYLYSISYHLDLDIPHFRKIAVLVNLLNTIFFYNYVLILDCELFNLTIILGENVQK